MWSSQRVPQAPKGVILLSAFQLRREAEVGRPRTFVNGIESPELNASMHSSQQEMRCSILGTRAKRIDVWRRCPTSRSSSTAPLSSLERFFRAVMRAEFRLVPHQTTSAECRGSWASRQFESRETVLISFQLSGSQACQPANQTLPSLRLCTQVHMYNMKPVGSLPWLSGRQWHRASVPVRPDRKDTPSPRSHSGTRPSSSTRPESCQKPGWETDAFSLPN